MAKEPEKKEDAVEVESKPSALSSWLPIIVVVIACPVLSFLLIQFVFLPQFEAKLIASLDTSAQQASGKDQSIHKKPAKKESKKGEEDDDENAAGKTYEFKNIITNISGSLQSRYIKVSFTIAGDDPTLAAQVEENKAKMTDATLVVLSALTLSDLEQPGIKNIVRSDLLGTYEALFHERLIKELYFSEFVIQ